MRIPKKFLNQEVMIQPYQGTGAYGPIYGTEFTEKWRVEPNRQITRDWKGDEVVSEVRGFSPHDSKVKTQDKVTWEGQDYAVLNARTQYGLRSISHIEVTLR